MCGRNGPDCNIYARSPLLTAPRWSRSASAGARGHWFFIPLQQSRLLEFDPVYGSCRLAGAVAGELVLQGSFLLGTVPFVLDVGEVPGTDVCTCQNPLAAPWVRGLAVSDQPGVALLWTSLFIPVLRSPLHHKGVVVGCSGLLAEPLLVNLFKSAGELLLTVLTITFLCILYQGAFFIRLCFLSRFGRSS